MKKQIVLYKVISALTGTAYHDRDQRYRTIAWAALAATAASAFTTAAGMVEYFEPIGQVQILGVDLWGPFSKYAPPLLLTFTVQVIIYSASFYIADTFYRKTPNVAAFIAWFICISISMYFSFSFLYNSISSEQSKDLLRMKSLDALAYEVIGKAEDTVKNFKSQNRANLVSSNEFREYLDEMYQYLSIARERARGESEKIEEERQRIISDMQAKTQEIAQKSAAAEFEKGNLVQFEADLSTLRENLKEYKELRQIHLKEFQDYSQKAETELNRGGTITDQYPEGTPRGSGPVYDNFVEKRDAADRNVENLNSQIDFIESEIRALSKNIIRAKQVIAANELFDAKEPSLSLTRSIEQPDVAQSISIMEGSLEDFSKKVDGPSFDLVRESCSAMQGIYPSREHLCAPKKLFALLKTSDLINLSENNFSEKNCLEFYSIDSFHEKILRVKECVLIASAIVRLSKDYNAVSFNEDLSEIGQIQNEMGDDVHPFVESKAAFLNDDTLAWFSASVAASMDLIVLAAGFLAQRRSYLLLYGDNDNASLQSHIGNPLYSRYSEDFLRRALSLDIAGHGKEPPEMWQIQGLLNKANINRHKVLLDTDELAWELTLQVPIEEVTKLGLASQFFVWSSQDWVSVDPKFQYFSLKSEFTAWLHEELRRCQLENETAQVAKDAV